MSRDKLKLAIIVIEYNSSEDTIKCLDSIEKHLGEQVKVYVYDNSTNSSKQVIDRIGSSGDHIEYHRNEGNIGFAKACNVGLTRAKNDGFDMAMLLNNDTEIVDDSALHSRNIFINNPELGILGLINYYSHSPSVIWQSGKNIRKSKLGFYHVPQTPESNITLCDYVAGSSFIIRLTLLDSIGLFDENYFAYYEEIDYCFRAKECGIKVGYMNNSRILHKVGASSDNSMKTYLKTRNMLYFYRSKIDSNIHFSVVVSILLIKSLFSNILNLGLLDYIKYAALGIKDFMSSEMKNKRIAEFE